MHESLQEKHPLSANRMRGVCGLVCECRAVSVFIVRADVIYMMAGWPLCEVTSSLSLQAVCICLINGMSICYCSSV